MSLAVPRDPSPRFDAGLALVLNLTLFLLVAAVWAVLAASVDAFWTPGNIANLLRQSALLAILAMGQTLVILTRGIDLSVGAMVGLSSVVVALLLRDGAAIPVAVAAALALGAAAGLVHGVLVQALRIPPFIVTLASMSVLTGAGLLVTNGATISGLPKAFTGFARSDVFGAPSLFLTVLMVGVPLYVLLKHTILGRAVFAVGSSPEAARLSGIAVGQAVALVYVLSGTLAALVGVLTASRISIGLATTGAGWELQAIAAAVIGGASLFGAVGGVTGSVLGAVLLATIANGANLMNINPFWQQIITGLLVVVIVFFDQSRRPAR